MLSSDYTIDELMVVAMAREIADGDIVALGLLTPMATVAAFLARETHAPRATVVLAGAVQPRTHNIALSLVNPVILASISLGFLSHTATMDMAERGKYAIQFLRPAQVDAEANMNTSLVGDSVRVRRLPGGLATGDVTLLLPRLILYQPHHEQRAFPARVDYVTGIGHPRHWSCAGGIHRGPQKIITNLCVLALRESTGRFAVESLHPAVSPEVVSQSTGFELEWPETTAQTPAPTEGELSCLRHLIDPLGIRRLEFRPYRETSLRRLESLQKEAETWFSQKDN
jgi:glutaconate CoA-transferase subunit B